VWFIDRLVYGGFVMPFGLRTLVAALLSIAFVAEIPGNVVSAASVGQRSSRVPIVAVNAAIPPERIPVKEPVRLRRALPSSFERPKIVQGVRPLNPVWVKTPQMLRPAEISRISELKRQQQPPTSSSPAVTPAVPLRAGRVIPTKPGTSAAQGAQRTVQSTPGGGSGTGINPWWRYQEENVPGGGHVMVNVGTGNVLLQDDDMSVPHKGIALAFRRTYNSQSLHNVNDGDGAQPGLYGNGWTNTFDAHIVGTPSAINVFDIDGAVYTYTSSNGGASWTPPAGQHARLVPDGGCGFMWIKKSGTIYYFYEPYVQPGCSWTQAGQGGFFGRMVQLLGRNLNVVLAFNYAFDGGNSSPTGKVSVMTITADRGQQVALTCADFNGHRLLQQLTYPDRTTTVTYAYDSLGNLATVSRPPNNAAGTRPVQGYYYQTIGSDSVLLYAASPRWMAVCPTSCGGDGGYLYFLFSGASAATSTLNTLYHGGTVNPVIADGVTNSALQPALTTLYSNYVIDYYTTGVTTPTFRDTDGHMTNWVVDSLGRPTQTQECTASSGQGTTCTGIWLLLNETWDTNNNLVATKDARGYESDSAYDANGNTIAAAAPQTTTSQGTFRPTTLYDYDAFNNVTAYCDQTETHAAGADWITPPASSDSLCSSHTVAHARFTFSYPSYEPYGELTALTTPLGYGRHFAYAPVQQNGADYGLPTSVTGDSFTQADGTINTPTQTFWYDGPGNLRCYSKGIGMYVLSYDSLGRMTGEADPDDSSANAGSLCGKTTGQSGWSTQTTYTYFVDGSRASAQTPAERAGSVSTTFSYDLDGEELTETHHHGCIPGSSCTAGVTTKWYDGADRLVEVKQPQDPRDLYTYPWLTRYIYDLSAGGNDTIASATFRGYGNLFKTQEWLAGPGATTPSWTDLHGNAFDALNRTLAKYTFSPSANTTLSTTTIRYDASAATFGLVSSQLDPLGETTTYTYDELGHQSAVSFAGDAGVTPAKSSIYDANGRVATASNSTYGSQTVTYDADGRASEADESTSGSITSPSRITYDYYPDGTRKDLNVASTALTAAPLVTYSRRVDGMMSKEVVKYAGVTSTFGWSYSDGGRKLTQTDPYTGTTMPSPHTPVNVGTAYAATNWSYDTTGQLASANLPETLNYTVARDFEGNITRAGASVTGSTTFAAALAFMITSRGESSQQISSIVPVHPANGVLVPAVVPLRVAPSLGSSPVFDPINAVVLGSNLTGNANLGDGQWTSCGPVPTIDTYDGASRLISRPNYSILAGCDVEGPETQTWAYDAENRTISQGFGNAAQWSPIGKPYHISGGGQPNDFLHYDGGTLLFTTDASGALTGIKVGALADIAPNGQMTVWDRDFSNRMVSGHNNSLYYGVAFGGKTYGPYPGVDGPATVPGGSVVTVFYGSGAGGCSVQPTNVSCPISDRYPYTRLDGFDWGSLTIQGVRVVDNRTAQWTTPDAYAGNVNDPSSQKPFMWNNNNPYSYADPSGFSPVEHVELNGDIVIAGVLSASSSQMQQVVDAGGSGQWTALLEEIAKNSLVKRDDFGDPSDAEYHRHFAGVGATDMGEYALKAMNQLGDALSVETGFIIRGAIDRFWILNKKTGNVGVYTWDADIITFLHPSRNPVEYLKDNSPGSMPMSPGYFRAVFLGYTLVSG